MKREVCRYHCENRRKQESIEQKSMRHEMETVSKPQNGTTWPDPPKEFPPIMTPTEAAQFLRLNQTAHSPKSAKRTLNYWREHGELKATKYARHVWYLKEELDKFLILKTEKDSR